MGNMDTITLIRMNWKGWLPLSGAFWIAPFAGYVAAALISFILSATTLVCIIGLSPGTENFTAMFWVSAILYAALLFAIVTVWATVGVWRSSGRSIEQRRREERALGGAALARIAVVLIGLAMFLQFSPGIGLLILGSALIVTIVDRKRGKQPPLGGDGFFIDLI